jgi:hypothetical protein
MPEDQAFALAEDAKPRHGDGARVPPAFFAKTAMIMKPSSLAAMDANLSIESNAGYALCVLFGANFGTRIAASFMPPTPEVSPRRCNGATED